MDNLRSAIADKVLDISSLEGNDVKFKLEKINRFRDFVNACQLLIQKYPAIETELLQMVENNDFDTRIASSRVDSVIRLSEHSGNGSVAKHDNVEADIRNLEEIAEKVEESVSEQPTDNAILSTVESSVANTPTSSTSALVDEQKQIDPARSVQFLTENKIDQEKEKQYVDFEEIVEGESSENDIIAGNNTVNSTLPLPEETIGGIIDRKPSITIESSNAKKDTAKKILLVCGIVAIVVALIFIIKFVINNWQVILYGLGVAVIFGGLVWFLLKKKKTDE